LPGQGVAACDGCGQRIIATPCVAAPDTDTAAIQPSAGFRSARMQRPRSSPRCVPVTGMRRPSRHETPKSSYAGSRNDFQGGNDPGRRAWRLQDLSDVLRLSNEQRRKWQICRKRPSTTPLHRAATARRCITRRQRSTSRRAISREPCTTLLRPTLWQAKPVAILQRRVSGMRLAESRRAAADMPSHQ